MKSSRASIFGLLLLACSGGTAAAIDPPAGSDALQATPAPNPGAAGGSATSAPAQQGQAQGTATGPTSTTPSPTAGSTPTTAPTTLPPAKKLEVSASVISATLGDECAAMDLGRFAPALCAPMPMPMEDSLVAGCGPICVESNLQLAFTTGSGAPAKVSIASVELHDAKTGKKLDTLTASAPKSWNGAAYADWNETLQPSSEVKASYTLSSPAWAKIAEPLFGQYKLLVTLRIDGELVTIESTTLSREPAVVT